MLDNKKGITLIALIITIIVLLILSGVTISAILGENGIIANAHKSSLETAKSKFIEDANLAYGEIYSETFGKPQFIFTPITISDVKTRLLEKYDYEGKIYTLLNTEATEIKLSQKEIDMLIEKSETVTIDLGDDTNFVEILGHYYPFKLNGSKIELGEELDDINGLLKDSLLSVENSNNNVANINFDSRANIITINSKIEGNTQITVKYKGITEVINVNIRLPYGQLIEIDNASVNGVQIKNWRYLYNDSDRIYLIYADYLENGAIPTYNSININGRNIYIDYNAGDVTDEEKNRARKHLQTYLSDKNVWNNISTSITNALNNNEKLKATGTTIDGVETIGGPTLELLRDSHNANYPNSKFSIKKYNGGEYLSDIGLTVQEGYLFEGRIAKDGKDPSGVYLAETEDKKLFFPYLQTTSDNVLGYYTTDLSAFATDSYCVVQCVNKMINRDGIRYDDRYGVRPVISLPISQELMDALGLKN